MPKVQLYVPPGGYFAERWSKGSSMPPLGLLYIGAVLEKAGVPVEIVPADVLGMSWADIRRKIRTEKPDIVGAVFGQTEGLLGAELEMRELQKEGKIGRIEVDLERRDKMTTGKIKIPTALDQSETTLIAAAIETIERIGPSDSQIEVERIEDVRGSKRDYILERAKKLMQGIEGSSDSREISNAIKDSAKTANIQEYGSEKLPCGDISGKNL